MNTEWVKILESISLSVPLNHEKTWLRISGPWVCNGSKTDGCTAALLPITGAAYLNDFIDGIFDRMGEMRRALSRGEESEADRGAAGRNRKESLIGTLLCVCTDCKEMVLQVCQHSSLPGDSWNK